MEQRLFAKGILTAGGAGAVLATAARVRAALGFTAKLGGAGKSLGALKLVLGGTVLVASITAVAPVLRQEQSTPKPVQRSAQPRVHIPVVDPSSASVRPPESSGIYQARSAQTTSDRDNLVAPERRLPAHRSALAVSPDTLARENALLIKASQQLHAGDHTSASRLLDQYDREFPRGVLRRERDVARERLRKLKSNIAVR
jgi:hypothetical protein